MKVKNYGMTKTACYLGYVSQAIAVTFSPLLFIHFNRTYGITLGEIALIPVLFFAVQLIIDIFCSVFVDRIGYRKCIVSAEVCTSAGLVGLAVLPMMMGSPFAGILISTAIYAVGSGLTEVLCNPIIEACPFSNKDSVITMLSAVYSFGCVGTVVIFSLFSEFIGIENWRYLAIALALIPAFNIINFAVCPIEPVVPEGKKMNPKNLFGNSMFTLFVIMMVCAGATELAMSQWSSAYAEVALNVTKEIGDISGPCAFALAEGIGRLLFSRFGEKMKLSNIMIFSGIVCLLCYIGIGLIPIKAIGLSCCVVCGFAVGVLWPGTINASAGFFPYGGTPMFSILAMAGDIGCSVGPGIVGKCSEMFGDNLRFGIGVGCIFPIVFILTALRYKKKKNEMSYENQPDN